MCIFIHIYIYICIYIYTSIDINIGFNSKIVPSLKKNHGKDSIINVSTIRLGKTIRIFHNYLPMINISQGIIKNEWPETAIFPKK